MTIFVKILILDLKISISIAVLTVIGVTVFLFSAATPPIFSGVTVMGVTVFQISETTTTWEYVFIGSRQLLHGAPRSWVRKHQYKNLRPKILIEYNSLPMPTLDSIGLLG